MAPSENTKSQKPPEKKRGAGTGMPIKIPLLKRDAYSQREVGSKSFCGSKLKLTWKEKPRAATEQIVTTTYKKPFNTSSGHSTRIRVAFFNIRTTGP